jgi:transposase InsO family protein
VLHSAIARRRPVGTVVVHSDRGSQFRARAFRAVLTAAGVRGSTGRVAAAGDNAAMDSFQLAPAEEGLEPSLLETRAELSYEVIQWIEHT